MKFHDAGLSCDEYAPARQSDWRLVIYAIEEMQETTNDPGMEQRSRLFGSMPYLGQTSLLFALLQSLCTAVLTISGIRVAIGLTALAAASGIWAPATGFHQDAIRIPMLTIAAAGAVVNLAVLAWIWHRRARPSAQWRRRAISRRERRSERLQVAMAILTLVLVGLETWTHTIVHRTGPPPAARSISAAAR